MSLLLDSHTLIWFLTEPKKLPQKTLRLIARPETAVWFSAVRLWELSLKLALGKLRFKNLSPEDIAQEAREQKEQNFDLLTLSETDTLGFRNVPRHLHHDFFDRMVRWQAMQRDLTLVSTETGLNKYRQLELCWIW